MRTFDHVDNKLFESDFFLQKMEEEDFNMFAMRCYFSAFVSSTRSVTFAIQASMKGTEGFPEWYEIIRQKLRDDQLARFFHECRTDDQKLGFNHVVGGVFDGRTPRFWFGEPERGRYKFLPEIDVLSACRKYMVKMCEIVDSAYERFGIEIDPDQRYTPAGLKKVGMSIEDLEDYLGFPRLYSKVSEDSEEELELRLASLVRGVPRSAVKPLLMRYLDRPLNYPMHSFRPSALGTQQPDH
ncbi:MAG: hypothetical protein JJU24_06390 [Natronohydrobacter sp.]|nr:hypothetical protein [Natronohydrobacter sp.]